MYATDTLRILGTPRNGIDVGAARTRVTVMAVVVVGIAFGAGTAPVIAAEPMNAQLSVSPGPGTVSVSAQPPVVVLPFGSCDQVWTADLANGERQGCAVEAWPAANSPAWKSGGVRGGTLGVAGGDTVTIHLDRDAQQVIVAGTTGSPPGC